MRICRFGGAVWLGQQVQGKSQVRQRLLAVFAGFLIAGGVHASGYRPPAHSELAYSFTCPSGASGHLRYVVDFTADRVSTLTLWVNGQYVQEDPMVSAGLRGRNIEQLQASCEGERTLLILRTFDPSASGEARLQWFSIHVDRAGKVMSAGE